jgi:hypothetical protein
MRRLGYAVIGMWMGLMGLLPASHLAELAKVPQLVNHYRTHLAEEGDDDFLTFLWEHYGNGTALHQQGGRHALSHHHSPLHDHSRLPFFSATATAVAFIPPQGIVLHGVQDRMPFCVAAQLPTYVAAKNKLLRPPRA